MELNDEEQAIYDRLRAIWTVEEESVYDLLSEAFNRMVNLPELHPVDKLEFAHHTNVLKNIIMSRPVAQILRELYQASPGRGGYTEIKESEIE